MKARLLCLALVSVIPLTQAATFTVTTTADSGAGSFRQAILDANAASGDDTIAFTVTGTITLASALPAINDNTTITGPGTNLLTISGNDSVQIFTVSAQTTTTLSGLTIANGRATNCVHGAGIANMGKLTILNCALVNNQNSGGWGGAVFNSGSLAVINSTFTANQVTGENGTDTSYHLQTSGGGGGAGMGGGLFSMSGTLVITACSFISNSATGGNGGSAENGTGNGCGGGVSRGCACGTGGFGSGGGGALALQCPAGNGGFGGGGGGASPVRDTAGGGGFGAGGGGAFENDYAAGGGGAALGGGIFVDSGTVTIVDCSFTGNQAVGGLGGYGGTKYIPPEYNAAKAGGNGSGIGPDFFNRAATILPKLTATTLGGGTVTVDPPNPPYLSNSLATLTARPAPGWRLLYWLGDVSGTNEMNTVHMTRNKYVQPVFGTQLTGSALMTLNPQVDFYPYGTVVKLTALPPTGTYFTSWSGDASGTNNPLSITVTNPNQVASYQLGTLSAGQFALTVIEDGQGHVGIVPRANRYNSGQPVTLTATPEARQDFLGWSGDAGGATNPLSVTMSQSKVITASFTKRPTLRVGTPLEGLVEDGFRLTLTSEFGIPYTILGSTNLTEWTPAGTVTNTYGTAQLTDPAATNLPYRYYRSMSDE